jgi:RimJ/RimL family protein N-acetyltransferase
MPGPVFIEGERVTLRPLEKEDLEFCVEHLNDPDVRRGLAGGDPLNSHQEEEWFEGTNEDDSTVVLAVAVDGAIAGTAGLHDLNERFGTAELGYWLAPDFHGQGYATEAAELVVDYAFAERRPHKVYAHIFEFNDASRCVVEKVGFEREGVHREEAYLQGDYVDIERYGLLEQEWRAGESRE